MDSASSNTVDKVRYRHFSASLARAASAWCTRFSASTPRINRTGTSSLFASCTIRSTSFEASEQLEHRTDRALIVRQQIRRILPCAPRPVGPNTAWLQRADLDPERRDLHRQSVAETAHGPLGRVIWRIAAVSDAATDRRHLKDVTALLLAHYRYGGTRCVNHAVETRVRDRLEVLRAYLLERRNLPITGIVDQDIQPPES